jgi:hypothetical protein
MRIWKQRAGELWTGENCIAKGYSGHGEGVNNPDMQEVVKVGPIPRGKYRMVGLATDNHTGPYSIILQPEPGTNTFGRSGFRIHGDNQQMNHSASEGCIILPPTIRHLLWESDDHEIEVVE